MKEGATMRYIMTLFWAFALGQVVGFLGGALSNQPYDFMLTTIFSLMCGVLVIILGKIFTPKNAE